MGDHTMGGGARNVQRAPIYIYTCTSYHISYIIWLSYIIYHISYIVYIIFHISYIKYHISSITYHISHIHHIHISLSPPVHIKSILNHINSNFKVQGRLMWLQVAQVWPWALLWVWLPVPSVVVQLAMAHMPGRMTSRRCEHVPFPGCLQAG